MAGEPQLITLAAGQTLFNEGDPGNTAFLIESGAIDVLRRQPGGATTRLASLGAGELLGEMALIDRQPRIATAVAATETRLRVINRSHYDSRFREADPLIRLFLRNLLQRHRSSVGTLPGPESFGESMQIDREQIMARLRLEQDLRAALDAGELRLHFQPIVAIRGERTAGFEALLRWQRPEGMVPPGSFIPLAEESDLIVDIGRWVLKSACAALARLRAEQKRRAPDDPPLFMTINVSGRQFASGLLYDDVSAAMAGAPLDGARVKLEITESLLMDDVQAAVALIARLKQLGAELAVDDFGTGYSSLNYLRQLDADTLKVDRAFVKDMETDRGSVNVLQAIKGLANGFGLETVVEGIERPTQKAELARIGFDFIQGWVYCKALPEDQALDLVAKRWGPG
jgi:EAL domain-containing protein (putative c-di-GMP-specific phosphodiesterase class I)